MNVWYTYGMRKTTIYLPDELKRKVTFAARKQGRSEAEVIRDAIEAAVKPAAPRPKIPLFDHAFGDPTIAERVDELLDELGFGRD